jgi:hypothetical protein
MKKEPISFYNNSDIGYMDEEWANYVAEVAKKELEKEQILHEEEVVEEV